MCCCCCCCWWWWWYWYWYWQFDQQLPQKRLSPSDCNRRVSLTTHDNRQRAQMVWHQEQTAAIWYVPWLRRQRKFRWVVLRRESQCPTTTSYVLTKILYQLHTAECFNVLELKILFLRRRRRAEPSTHSLLYCILLSCYYLDRQICYSVLMLRYSLIMNETFSPSSGS